MKLKTEKRIGDACASPPRNLSPSRRLLTTSTDTTFTLAITGSPPDRIANVYTLCRREESLSVARHVTRPTRDKKRASTCFLPRNSAKRLTFDFGPTYARLRTHASLSPSLSLSFYRLREVVVSRGQRAHHRDMGASRRDYVTLRTGRPHTTKNYMFHLDLSRLLPTQFSRLILIIISSLSRNCSSFFWRASAGNHRPS